MKTYTYFDLIDNKAKAKKADLRVLSLCHRIWVSRINAPR